MRAAFFVEWLDQSELNINFRVGVVARIIEFRFLDDSIFSRATGPTARMVDEVINYTIEKHGARFVSVRGLRVSSASEKYVFPFSF